MAETATTTTRDRQPTKPRRVTETRVPTEIRTGTATTKTTKKIRTKTDSGGTAAGGDTATKTGINGVIANDSGAEVIIRVTTTTQAT